MADQKKPAEQQKKRQRSPIVPAAAASVANNNKTPSPPVAAAKMAPMPAAPRASPPVAAPAMAPAALTMAPSPLAMVKPIAVVKREREDGEVLEGGDGRAGPMVLSAAEAEEGVDLKLKKKWLHCAGCSAPLHPPVFMREDGRVVCGPCSSVGGLAAIHVSYMDGLVGACEVPCPYTKFGCARSMAYHATADHTATCACAPCYCFDCPFEGPPASLLRHLTEESGRHRWPAEKIKYETARTFVVPASEHRVLLVAEEDGRLFLLAVGASRGPSGVLPVSVVCVRGQWSSATRPLYTGMLCVDGPPVAAGHLRGGSQLKGDVPNCGVPSEVDMEHGSLHAHVNPELLHGDSKELHLRISITRIPRISASPSPSPVF